MLLLGLFLASAVVFYVFYLVSDSFWNLPIANQPARPNIDTILDDTHPFDDDPLGQLDL